jgi:hypothetical protein
MRRWSDNSGAARAATAVTIRIVILSCTFIPF